MGGGRTFGIIESLAESRYYILAKTSKQTNMHTHTHTHMQTHTHTHTDTDTQTRLVFPPAYVEPIKRWYIQMSQTSCFAFICRVNVVKTGNIS